METPDIEQLRQQYSQSSDDELLRLVVERENLTAPAQEALQREIEKRALEWKGRTSESSPSITEAPTKRKWNLFRWFWPVILNEKEAKRAAKSGAYGAIFVAIVTCIFSLIAVVTGEPFVGIDRWALVDAVLFGIIAWRIFRYSFPWAVIGLLLYLCEILWRIWQEEPQGNIILTALIMLSFVAGVRGTAFLDKAQKINRLSRFRFESVPVVMICVALIITIAYHVHKDSQDKMATMLLDKIDAEIAQKNFHELMKDYKFKDWSEFRNEILSREQYLVNLKEKNQYIQSRLQEKRRGSDSCGGLDIEKGEPALQGVISSQEHLVSFAKDNLLLTEDSRPNLRSLVNQDDDARKQWNLYVANRKEKGCDK